MIEHETIGIDARMIEMSGIGTHIQHLMGCGLYDYAVGVEEEIRRYDRDVRVIPFDARIYGPKEQLRFPTRALSQAGVRIMHFPHYNVPACYRGRYVVTIHDLTHIRFPSFLGNRAKYWYAKWLMTRAVRHADHIFTVSRFSAGDIRQAFSVDPQKISLTYNAIDGDFEVRDPSSLGYLYERFAIPRGGRTVLYVGNLKPHKNLGTLLEAFATMRDEGVTLLLVGKAFEGVGLSEQERRLGLEGRVIHTGPVAKQELVDLYNLADVFAFPSLYEGFGIPPLEAMACGTPVVAADTSSIPEVVGDAALLVEATDAKGMAQAIRRFLDDADLYDEYRARGLVRCHDFSWRRTVEAVREGIVGALRA